MYKYNTAQQQESNWYASHTLPAQRQSPEKRLEGSAKQMHSQVTFGGKQQNPTQYSYNHTPVNLNINNYNDGHFSSDDNLGDVDEGYRYIGGPRDEPYKYPLESRMSQAVREQPKQNKILKDRDSVNNYNADGFGAESDEEDQSRQQELRLAEKKNKKQPSLKNRNMDSGVRAKEIQDHELRTQQPWYNGGSIDAISKQSKMTSRTKDKMYESLFHKVMKAKSPGNRISGDNAASTYSAGIIEIQDKSDKEYQRQLYKINQEAYQRMQEEYQKQEFNKRQLAIQIKNQEREKEMEECTFQPQVKESLTARALKEQVGDRSTQAQGKIMEQTLAKRSSWLALQKKEQEKKIRSDSRKKFISKGTAKILRDKSRTLNESGSVNSFLQRNYYNSKVRQSSNMSNGFQNSQMSQRENSASSRVGKMVRDISGNKVPFLNSGSLTKINGKTFDTADGRALFSPQINKKSALMSPREADTTFHMLHTQAVNQKMKLAYKTIQADHSAKRLAEKTEAVNKKSDSQLVKQFKQEFSVAIQQQLERSDEIYLIDVLKQLQFVNETTLHRQTAKVHIILGQQRQQLFFATAQGTFDEEATKNLFKVCCAILNYRPKQSSITNQLPDQVLKMHLDQINDGFNNRETILIDQFHAIKEICHRKSFQLSEKQIGQIHKKFQNLCIARKEFLYTTQKSLNQQRIKEETALTHQPQINHKSRELDQTSQMQSNVPRSEIMYRYAQKYNEHKEQLRESVKDKDLEGATFKPALNIKSVALANNSMTNFNKRTMDQYLNKHKREDRDADLIEAEKAADQLTFHPKIGSSKPRIQQIRQDNVSPANMQRERKSYDQIVNNKKTAPINKGPIVMKGGSKPNQKQNPYKQQEEQKTIDDYLADEPEEDENDYEPPKQHEQPQQFAQPTGRAPYNSYLPVVEEPICVLKIELDGEHIEEIKLFENDNPVDIVKQFGDQFNLSNNARQRLLEQIEEQIQMDDESETN